MHIGLIGGIGPAATKFYYRTLVSLYAQAGRRLELTIANADVREMTRHLEAGDRAAQATIFARYIDRLKAGACDVAALTSMGGHFCIEELQAVSSLPLISALPALEDYFSTMGVGRVGVLGTRPVMISGLYDLAAVEVITVPEADLQTVHAHYTAMAMSGQATAEQRAFFEDAALRLLEAGAEAIVLGGTDLFLAFDKPAYPYRLVDCGRVHAEAIAHAALR